MILDKTRLLEMQDEMDFLYEKELIKDSTHIDVSRAINRELDKLKLINKNVETWMQTYRER